MSQVGEHTETLLQLCLKGDQKAQMEIYNRYYKAMYNTALRIVKDTAEAEDVMQEAFLSAFTKLDTFRGEVTFGAWLKIPRLEFRSFKTINLHIKILPTENQGNL